jgi:hypothetical protein
MTATPSGRTFSFVSEGADDVKARAEIEALGRRFVTTEIKLDAARIIQENFSHSLQPRPFSPSFASRLCARCRSGVLELPRTCRHFLRLRFRHFLKYRFAVMIYELFPNHQSRLKSAESQFKPSPFFTPL